jgi:hypothetical protein
MKNVMIILMIALASTFIVTPVLADPPAISGIVVRYDEPDVEPLTFFVDKGMVVFLNYDFPYFCDSGNKVYSLFSVMLGWMPATDRLVRAQVKGDDCVTSIWQESVLVFNEDGSFNLEKTCDNIKYYPGLLIAEGTVDGIATDNNYLNLLNDNNRGKTYNVSYHGVVYDPDDVSMENPMILNGHLKLRFNDEGELKNVSTKINLNN